MEDVETKEPEEQAQEKMCQMWRGGCLRPNDCHHPSCNC